MDEEKIKFLIASEIRNHLTISVRDDTKVYDPNSYITIDLQYKGVTISSDYIQVPYNN